MNLYDVDPRIGKMLRNKLFNHKVATIIRLKTASQTRISMYRGIQYTTNTQALNNFELDTSRTDVDNTITKTRITNITEKKDF